MAVELKYEWINAIKNHGPESSTRRYVLLMLSTYMNLQGSCFPSTELLANESLLSERSVCTHLIKAENEGWIQRTVRGNGQGWKRHEYKATIPTKALNDVQHVSGQGTEPLSVRQNEKALNLTTEGTEPHDIKALNDVQSNISYEYINNRSLLNDRKDTIQDKKIIKKDIPESTDSFLLAEHLLNRILERRPTFKKPNMNTWAKQIDLMLGKDKRTSKEIRAVIDWCQSDPFWQSRILSTSKLRDKFDMLAMQMEQKNSGSGFRKKTLLQSEPFTQAGYYE